MDILNINTINIPIINTNVYNKEVLSAPVLNQINDSNEDSSSLPSFDISNIEFKEVTTFIYNDETEIENHYSYLSEGDIPLIDQLKSVYFGKNVSIGSRVLANSSVKLIVCHPTAYFVGSLQFDSCSLLVTLVFPNYNTIPTDCAKFCSKLQNIVFPNNLVEIKGSAFWGCNKLKVPAFPSTLREIGYRAFSDNMSTYYKGGYYISTYLQYTDPDKFTGEFKPNTISIGSIYCSDDITSLTIPNTVYHITGEIYGNVLQSVLLSNSMTEISDGLLKNTLISTIIIPDSVKSIGDYAFAYCPNLNSILLPNSLESIGEYAFKNCNNLLIIIIPRSVTYIDQDAFAECPAALYVNFNFQTQFLSRAVDKIILGPNVTKIGESAFYGCAIKNIEISNYVRTIEENAFLSCSRLTDIVIPYSVNYIGMDAFSWCSSLASVTFDGSVDMYDPIFTNCNSRPLTFTFNAPMPTYEFLYGLDDVSVVFNNEVDLESLLELSDDIISSIHFGKTGRLIYNREDISSLLEILRLNSISCDPENEYFYAENGYLFDSATNSLILASNSCSEIPDTTTEIIGTPFINSKVKFDTFELPASILSIDGDLTGLLLKNDGLTNNSSVRVNEDNDYLNINFFDYKTDDGLYIKDTTIIACDDDITDITFPDGVVNIMPGVFALNQNLRKVTLNNLITTITPNAFLRCTNLVLIEFPSNVLVIGDSAFRSCSNLRNVTLPATIRSIGNNAFYSIKGPVSVYTTCITNSQKYNIFGSNPTVNWYNT